LRVDAADDNRDTPFSRLTDGDTAGGGGHVVACHLCTVQFPIDDRSRGIYDALLV